ncbi:hypothetical protein LTR95_017960, partial [Oleoguttula sp. CCFEE 5521]
MVVRPTDKTVVSDHDVDSTNATNSRGWHADDQAHDTAEKGSSVDVIVWDSHATPRGCS